MAIAYVAFPKIPCMNVWLLHCQRLNRCKALLHLCMIPAVEMARFLPYSATIHCIRCAKVSFFLHCVQVFLLCAVKFHCTVCAISWMQRPKPAALLFCIRFAITYMAGLVRSRMMTARKSTFGGCGNVVSRCHIVWLGLTGFCWILGKKQSAYKEVLECLEQERRRDVYRHLWRHLNSVTDDRKSSIFRQMIY